MGERCCFGRIGGVGIIFLCVMLGAGVLVSLDLLMIEVWIMWGDFWCVCRGREFVGMVKILCFGR